MKKSKQPKYFITPMGNGKYHAVWQEGTTIYDIVYNDRNEEAKIRAMKNPYKNNIFPYVYIPYDDKP